jgi:hypothetical protein
MKKWTKWGIGLGLGAGLAAAAYALVVRPWQLRRGATDEEVRRALPGDALIPHPKHGYTQAITIQAPPSEVWPWLVQIGHQRAGWYSHDALHRLLGIAGSVEFEDRSAEHVIPELQSLQVGDEIEIAPEMGYQVVTLQPERALVLYVQLDLGTWEAVESGAALPERYLRSSWAWVLEPRGEDRTRLIVRVRSDYDDQWNDVLAAVVPNELGSLIMQPKTLQGIKARAEKGAYGA